MAEATEINAASATGNATPNRTSDFGVIPAPKTIVEWLQSTFVTRQVAGTMKIEDFLAITGHQDSGTAYWRETHIDWALEILRAKYKRLADEVLIAPIWYSQCCYMFGMHQRNLSRKDYKSEFEEMKSKQVIILPVNNGFGREYPEELKEGQKPSPEENTGNLDKSEKESKRESNKKSNKKSTAKHLGHGNHWSLIIIDKRNNSARYIDPVVRPKKNNGTWRPSDIDFNAPIAGMVLCGFDDLLGREKGKFETSTLKWTPHQSKHNRSRHDAGACGPYIYAILDYLLSNKNFIDDGIKTSFARKERRKHRHGLNFRSLETRREVSNALWEERKRREAQIEELLVANLTTEILNIFVTPELLRNVANSIVSGQSPFSTGSHSLGSLPRSPQAGAVSSHSLPDSYNDPMSDTDFRNWWMRKQAKSIKTLPDEVVASAMNADPSEYRGLTIQECRQRMAFRHWKSAPPSEDDSSESEATEDTEQYKEPKFLPRPNKERKILPRLFINLTQPQMDEWRKTHRGRPGMKGIPIRSDKFLAIILQKLYQGGFEKGILSDNDIRTWHRKDQFGFFDEDSKDWPVDRLRQELVDDCRNFKSTNDTTLFPHAATYLRLGPLNGDDGDNAHVEDNLDGGSEYDAQNPEGEAGESENLDNNPVNILAARNEALATGANDATGDQNTKANAEKARVAKAKQDKAERKKVTEKQAKKDETAKNLNKNGKRPLTDKSSSSQGPAKRARHDGIPEDVDLKTINFAQVRWTALHAWDNEVNQKLWEHEKKPIATVVKKAYLHAKFKGSFLQESDKDCDKWRQDPAAFKGGAGKDALTHDNVRRGMERYYCTEKKGVSYSYTVDFTHMDDDEVRRWMERNPDIAGQDIVEVERRPSLQRAFGGGFDHLIDDDIVYWRSHFPGDSAPLKPAEIRHMLDQMLATETGRTVEDRRGQWKFYPGHDPNHPGYDSADEETEKEKKGKKRKKGPTGGGMPPKKPKKTEKLKSA